MGLPGLVVLGIQYGDFGLNGQGSQAPLDSMIRSGDRSTPKRYNFVSMIALQGPTRVHNALGHVPHTFVEQGQRLFWRVLGEDLHYSRNIGE